MRFFLALLLISFVFSCTIAKAASIEYEKRIALLIGNDQYLGTLNNLGNACSNDVDSMKAVLTLCKFDVVSYKNLSTVQLKDSLSNFFERSKNYDVVLVYYSGHGVSIDAKNYIVPINVQLPTVKDWFRGGKSRFMDSAVEVGKYIFKAFNAKKDKKFNLFIFDACRSDVDAAYKIGTVNFLQSKSITNGFFQESEELLGAGTCVLYAAGPLHTAFAKVDGENSIFTEELLKTLPTPNENFLQVFNMACKNIVDRQLPNFQTPQITGQLWGDFCFFRRSALQLQILNGEPKQFTIRDKYFQEGLFAEALKVYEEQKSRLSDSEILNLAKCYYKVGKFDSALKYYKVVADKGNSQAILEEAEFFSKYSKADKKDSLEEIRLLKLAADKGNTEAMYLLGFIYNNIDSFQSLKWFRLSADYGDVMGIVKVADIYYQGIIGGSPNYDLAFRFYKQAADSNEVNSMSKLGAMYYYGQGTMHDVEKAQFWVKKALDQGVIYAWSALLDITKDYLSKPKPNYVELKKWLEIFQDKIDFAAYDLGWMYYSGLDSEKEWDKAIEAFQKVSKIEELRQTRVLANTFYYLGLIYYQGGYGVIQNFEQAYNWFNQGASLNETRSMIVIGDMYAFGYGFSKDKDSARRWYQKAKDFGDVEAKNKIKLLKSQ